MSSNGEKYQPLAKTSMMINEKSSPLNKAGKCLLSSINDEKSISLKHLKSFAFNLEKSSSIVDSKQKFLMNNPLESKTFFPHLSPIKQQFKLELPFKRKSIIFKGKYLIKTPKKFSKKSKEDSVEDDEDRKQLTYYQQIQLLKRRFSSIDFEGRPLSQSQDSIVRFGSHDHMHTNRIQGHTTVNYYYYYCPNRSCHRARLYPPIVKKEDQYLLFNYDNMTENQKKSIKSFFCQNTILLIVAVILFSIYHLTLCNNLTILDRETIDYWQMDWKNIEHIKPEIFLHNTNHRIDRLKYWIIILELSTLAVFIFGMFGFCYHDTISMRFYRLFMVPLMAFLTILLFITIATGWIFWKRLLNMESEKFIMNHYNDIRYRWLHIYMHHTHQWFRCCDWQWIQNENVTKNPIPSSCCYTLARYNHTKTALKQFLSNYDEFCSYYDAIGSDIRCGMNPIAIGLALFLILMQLITICTMGNLIQKSLVIA